MSAREHTIVCVYRLPSARVCVVFARRLPGSSRCWRIFWNFSKKRTNQILNFFSVFFPVGPRVPEPKSSSGSSVFFCQKIPIAYLYWYQYRISFIIERHCISYILRRYSYVDVCDILSRDVCLEKQKKRKEGLIDNFVSSPSPPTGNSSCAHNSTQGDTCAPAAPALKGSLAASPKYGRAILELSRMASLSVTPAAVAVPRCAAVRGERTPRAQQDASRTFKQARHPFTALTHRSVSLLSLSRDHTKQSSPPASKRTRRARVSSQRDSPRHLLFFFHQ